MKSKLMLFYLSVAVTLFATAVPGYAADKITNYYIYEGQPYYLNLNTGSIFIKFSEAVTKANFRNIAGEYQSLFAMENFDEKEDKQIVKLQSSMNTDQLTDMISILKAKSEIEYVSPVFGMPEGKGSPRVQIGFENEIIVHFREYLSEDAVSDFISSRNLTKVQQIDLGAGLCFVLRISPELNCMDVANDVFYSGLVKSSEPNFFFTNLLSYMPNDTYINSQWSVKNTSTNVPGGIVGAAGCDMRVDSAWNITLGSSNVLISVVDSGIDTLHQDLAANLKPGTGYNFYNNTPGGMDDNAHGTCCAGIIGAVGNNSLGTSGISPNCKMIAVKIFSSGGNTTSAAITNGLNYSWQQGQWVSSNSWGGGAPIAAANTAITNGRTLGRSGKGTIFVFATGNDNAAVSWPATQSDVLSVGGVSPCNQRKSLSSCDLENWWGANYGTGLHIVAPCAKVYASDRTGAAGYSPTNYYSEFNGTSSATPNAAGVCALILAVDTTLRWDSVRARIDRFADKVGSYTYNQAGPLGTSGWNNQMGYGKVNAYRAVKYTFDQLYPAPVSNVVGLMSQGMFINSSPYWRLADTIRLYLHRQDDPGIAVDSSKVVISDQPYLSDVIFNNALSGNYYLVVKHRNSLETWSNTAFYYNRGTAFNKNFITPGESYGDNMAMLTPSETWRGMYSGDVTRDGFINLIDVLQIYNDASTFLSGYIVTDLTGDNVTDLNDLLIAYNNSSSFVSRKAPPGASLRIEELLHADKEKLFKMINRDKSLIPDFGKTTNKP